VGKHDDELVRQFVAARDRGDEAEQRRLWAPLSERLFLRIEALVTLEHAGRLSAEEAENAVGLALVRISKDLRATFRGTSMGELVNLTKRAVRFACMDAQRESMKHKHASLDEWRETDEGQAASTLEREQAFRSYEQVQDDLERKDFLLWALPQLKGKRRRAAELSLGGATIDELMQELDVSQVNAYALVSRAMRDLRNLHAEYDA
jgi:hypothetical protein